MLPRYLFSWILSHFFTDATPTLESAPAYSVTWSGLFSFGGHNAASGAHQCRPLPSHRPIRGYASKRMRCTCTHLDLSQLNLSVPNCPYLYYKWQTVPTSCSPFSFPAHRTKTSLRLLGEGRRRAVETDSKLTGFFFSNFDISVYLCRTNGRTVGLLIPAASPKGISLH